MEAGPRAAVLTISSSRSRGEGADLSGPALASWAEALGFNVAAPEVIDDDRDQIEGRLRELADDEGFALVLTTGGTGFAPADHTPEATRAVIERDAPGIPEAMRAASRPHTANWMLSRAVAGIRGTTLIINFPGSPRSIEQAGAAIADALAHALALIRNRATNH